MATRDNINIDALMATQIDPHKLVARFLAAYGTTPRLFVGPGRINIIGEHVDYCGGYVMPAAIDRACYVASAQNGLNVLRVESDFGSCEIPLNDFQRQGDWRDYVAGMAFALRDAGLDILGHDLMITSTVPVGAGVSSSAALEVGIGLALTHGTVHGPRLAQIAQRAEKSFMLVWPVASWTNLPAPTASKIMHSCLIVPVCGLSPLRCALMLVFAGGFWG
ncbi:MAG: hypothetical protein HC777_00290 [Hyphomonadaceae bacterium]|nr:hypothetical protein [Hyphomonadaceae bacterium]